MVTKEQFINGVLAYIDDEVIPSLPSAGKWGLGTIVLLGSSKADKLFDELAKNNVIQVLDIIDKNNMVDIDKLAEAVKKSADRYGKLSLTIPVLGVLSFDGEDVNKLARHIKGGAQ